MILYFSGTGNTKYVANLLAKELDDVVIDLLTSIKDDKPVTFKSETPFVLCFPSYIMNIPVFIKKFLQNVTLEGSKYVYSVITCASESGIASLSIKEIVENKGKTYYGNCDVVMANNYVVNTRFNSTPDNEIKFCIKEAKIDVKRIAMFISNTHSFKLKKVSFVKKLMIKTVESVYVKTGQSSEPFHNNGKCISCGKCVSLCHVNKIHFDASKHPIWEKSCMHCMSCIGNCPVEAIDYGDVTQNKVKYSIEKYLTVK